MSTAVQLAGLALIITGTLILSLPVGLIVAGVAALLIGLALTN
jgi:hypothetical protein